MDKQENQMKRTTGGATRISTATHCYRLVKHAYAESTHSDNFLQPLLCNSARSSLCVIEFRQKWAGVHGRAV